MIGFDLETWGVLPEYALQAYRVPQAGVRAVSVANTEIAIGTLNPPDHQFQSMMDAWAGKQLVAWNTPFDLSWLYALEIKCVDQVNWLDAMLLWRHLTVEPEEEGKPRKSYSLEAAMKEFFPDQAGFKEFTDFQTTDPEELKKLLHRNKEDARFTCILGEKFWSELSPRQRAAALIESRCLPMVAQTYVDGIWIDREALKTLKDTLKYQAEKAYNTLKNHYPAIDEVNLGSPKQLSELLYNVWHLTPPRITAKGAPSTDKFALHELAETYPQARLLRDYREAKYNLAKYVTSTEASLTYNGDGRVRPQAKVFATYTGRMSYYSKQGKGKQEKPTGIALHQWKRGQEFRDVIIPPPGYSLIELDFAGQEFRWMAVASKDETMLSLCAPGEDAHSYMGARVAGIDYRELMRTREEPAGKKQRKLGKFANLSFQYRIGAKAAAVKARVEYELNLSEGEVRQLIAKYQSSYPGVPIYWVDAVNLARKNGYAETFAGRRVQLRNQATWAADSTSINYPIQGTGADQKYLALAIARNVLPDFDGKFYMELHDGLFFVIPEAKAEKGGRELQKILSNLPYKQAWGIDFPIQFPVDLKIGPSWGQLKEVK